LMKEAIKCYSCGFCLAACPVYQVLGVETLSSRGRIDTVRGMLLGELELTPRMEEILSTCLLCMACEASCPPGVAAKKLILEGRHRAVERDGLPLLKRWAHGRLLKDRRALGRALGFVSILQKMGPPAQQGGHLRHLPALFSGIAGGRALPPLAPRPLHARVPERTPPWPGAGHRGKVALFVGCYLDFVDSPIGEAAVQVLASQGLEVVLPGGQVCCGAPVIYSGDLKRAMEIAPINARAFADPSIDAVVSLCATCGSALRKEYPVVAGHLEAEDRDLVLNLSEKVQDISELLSLYAPLRGLTEEVQLTVTYHDPCHNVRGQGISREPRRILQEVPGVRQLEMAEPARCCGGGGSFSLTHPEVSLEVGRWKVEDILSTGADAVVTSCPGCILQIQEVAARERAPFQVLHLVEVVHRALPPRQTR